MIVLIATSVFSLSLVIASLWFMYCNNLTFKQRRVIINIIHELPVDTNWPTMWKQYEAVSYNQHLTCLLLCRNPWKLYKVKNNEQA